MFVRTLLLTMIHQSLSNIAKIPSITKTYHNAVLSRVSYGIQGGSCSFEGRVSARLPPKSAPPAKKPNHGWERSPADPHVHQPYSIYLRDSSIASTWVAYRPLDRCRIIIRGHLGEVEAVREYSILPDDHWDIACPTFLAVKTIPTGLPLNPRPVAVRSMPPDARCKSVL